MTIQGSILGEDKPSPPFPEDIPARLTAIATACEIVAKCDIL